MTLSEFFQSFFTDTVSHANFYSACLHKTVARNMDRISSNGETAPHTFDEKQIEFDEVHAFMLFT